MSGWKIFAIVVVILAFVLVAIGIANNRSGESSATPSPTQPPVPSQLPEIPNMEPGPNPLNTTYLINGQPITLSDGVNEEEISNSSTKIVTSNFGVPIDGDLNADGVDDSALMLVQEPGGSGTFYYIATSIDLESEWYGTNAILIGDRIAPQTTDIVDGVIIVNYADRPEGAPMSEQPSVAVSKYFEVEDTLLSEIPNPNL